MTGEIPTVRVLDAASPDGWTEINTTDFNAEMHARFEGDVDVQYPSWRIVHP